MRIIDKRKSIRKHPTKRPSTRKLTEIDTIVVHHSLTTSGSAEAFANYHVGTNGWSVMGYTYVINRDGTIDWCADYTTVTPHVGNHNKRSLGICLVGDFRTQSPTDAQYKALIDLLRKVQSELPNTCAIKGHSELPGYGWKACPVIDMNRVRSDTRGANRLDANIKYEGKSVEGFIEDGRTYVQARDLVEMIGLKIRYDAKTKTVIIEK